MVNLYDVYDQIKENERIFFGDNTDARVRLWDGNWKLIDEVEIFYSVSFTFLLNDAGSASLQLPLDSTVAVRLMDPELWPTKALYVTIDKDGARWSGRLEGHKVIENHTGESHLEFLFVHDYIKLKELLVWANPFLPAEVQFPKAFTLYGPARWAVATTLFVNLLRKNNSLWMLPDDPLDILQWVDLDMSDWNIVCQPVSFLNDSSLTAVVTSRFRTFHDTVVDIVADAQLSIECRRWLEGDPKPWPGANLRNGALVVEVVDKAGWNKETAFGGNMLSGLVRAIRRVGSDGITEGLDYIPRVEQPDEYYQLGWSGSLPEAPWVVLEHGPDTGMKSSSYEYIPPGPSQFVDGGSSLPGVNELIKASVIGIGGFLGSFILQSQLGSVAAEILEPLYSDVFMAFKAEKHHDRIKEQGWDFPFEHWVGSSSPAYTLSSLAGLRKAKYDTRERFSVQVEMENGAPYKVGSQGQGDFFIGDRVAVHALGMPEDRLMVEMVEELTYTESADQHGWDIGLGKPEFESGLGFIAQRLESTRSAVTELGVW